MYSSMACGTVSSWTTLIVAPRLARMQGGEPGGQLAPSIF